MGEAVRVCVAGAGPGGLSHARALEVHGPQFDVFERHSDVGGTSDGSFAVGKNPASSGPSGGLPVGVAEVA